MSKFLPILKTILDYLKLASAILENVITFINEKENQAVDTRINPPVNTPIDTDKETY